MKPGTNAREIQKNIDVSQRKERRLKKLLTNSREFCKYLGIDYAGP